MGYVETVRDGVLSWLEDLRYKDEGWGRWPYHARMDRPYSLQASGAAISLLNRFGRLDVVSTEEKHEAAEFIQSCQDPADGYFKDPLETEDTHEGPHSWEKIWNQRSNAAGVLPVLGAEPLYPPPAKRFVDLHSEDVTIWLDSLDWTDPWSNSEVFSRALRTYGETLDIDDRTDEHPVFNAAFEYYEQRLVDPATGFPMRGGCASLQWGMAAIFKVLKSYNYVGRDFPFAEQAIDATLALQRSDGDFAPEGRYGSLYTWDALWVLRELNYQFSSGYRFADIRDAGDRCAELAMTVYRKPDGGFALNGTECQHNHHSIRLSPRGYPIGDMLGTSMNLSLLGYVDEWNAGEIKGERRRPQGPDG